MRREICSGSHRRPSALLRKTMLGAAAPLVLAALLAPSASLADGGAGGAGDLGRVLGGLVPLGGLGGGDGQSGGDGVDGHTVIVTGSGAGGGGGGGGAGGGLGGAGGPGAPQPLFPTLFGGAGGTGGDGGNNGLTAVQVNIGAPITGGAGRRGGDGLAGTDDGGGGGGGGSGGNALVIVSSSANSSIGTIRGGVGGIGGSGGGAAAGGGNGGSGGDGGAAVSLIGVSASFINGGTLQGGNGGSGGVGGIGGSIGHGGSGGTGGAGISMPFIATLVNNGSITGGNGALAGSEQSANAALGSGPGHNGGGGVGIIGAGATVINAGIISGGLSANGLTRANAITFNGGTNSLTLQAGSSITGNVLAFSSADTLALGGSANANFDASAIGSQYLGFGNFQKTGTSTWTLAGIDAAARSWSVDAGTLSVNATVNGAVMTVNSGGTLSGTGRIGGATVRSGGTFMPGSGTAGTSITVGGNLAFQSGAIYLAQINPTTASLTNVTGTAALAGTVQAAFAPGSYVSRQYHLLHASALSGSFGSLGTTNLPVGFSGSLSYTATDVVLDLAVRVATSGSITNQDAVSTAISTFFNGGGALPPGFVTLLGLSGGNLANALGQLSGEPATGAQQATFNGMTMFMGILTDPTIEGRGGGSGSAGAMPFAQTGQDSAAAYAEARGKRNGSETDSYAMFSNAPMRQGYDPRWSVWSVAFGGSQTTEGNVAAGSNATSSRLFGVAAGADVLLSPRTIAGFAMAGGGTNFSVANSLGSGRSDLFQAGVFVRHTAGAAYISGALGYGWQDVTTNRTVLVAGVDRLRAQFNANAYSARFESGYRVVAPWTGMGITPYAAAQFTMFDLPAYAEQMVLGSGSFALGYGSRRVADSRTELGLRADKSVALSDSVLTVRSALGWAHQYNTDRNVAATFQALPGSSFVVNGASAARNSALTTASAEVKWMNGWSTIATFQGEFSGISESYAGKGVARFQW